MKRMGFKGQVGLQGEPYVLVDPFSFHCLTQSNRNHHSNTALQEQGCCSCRQGSLDHNLRSSGAMKNIWGHEKCLAEQNYKAVHLLVELAHLNALIYKHWLQISFCSVRVFPICPHDTRHFSQAWRLTGPTNVLQVTDALSLEGMCSDAHSQIHIGTHVCTQVNTHSHTLTCCGVCVFSNWRAQSPGTGNHSTELLGNVPWDGSMHISQELSTF